jgi:endoglycosylceramidase
MCLSAGCPEFERDTLANFYRRVTSAIRRVDRATAIFYEPNIFAGVGSPTNLPRLSEPHAVYDWHLYVAPDKQASLFARAAKQTGGKEPQFLTEFGSTVDTSTIVHAEALADRHLIGWMEWTYSSTGSTNTAGTPSLVNDLHRPPTGTNVDRAQLDAVVRPYAPAIAGLPTSLSYDPATRTLKLRYRHSRSVTAPTVIMAPELICPHGPHVTVHGGQVVGDRSGVITIHSTGTTSVTVIVKP